MATTIAPIGLAAITAFNAANTGINAEIPILICPIIINTGPNAAASKASLTIVFYVESSNPSNLSAIFFIQFAKSCIIGSRAAPISSLISDKAFPNC